MSQDMISFGCPSCGVQLRVPPSMAGVKGPCPRCRNPIVAPNPAPAPSTETPDAKPGPEANPEPRAARAQSPAPAQKPAPAADLTSPAPAPAPASAPAPADSPVQASSPQAPAEPAPPDLRSASTPQAQSTPPGPAPTAPEPASNPLPNRAPGPNPLWSTPAPSAPAADPSPPAATDPSPTPAPPRDPQSQPNAPASFPADPFAGQPPSGPVGSAPVPASSPEPEPLPSPAPAPASDPFAAPAPTAFPDPAPLPASSSAPANPLEAPPASDPGQFPLPGASSAFPLSERESAAPPSDPLGELPSAPIPAAPSASSLGSLELGAAPGTGGAGGSPQSPDPLSMSSPAPLTGRPSQPDPREESLGAALPPMESFAPPPASPPNAGIGSLPDLSSPGPAPAPAPSDPSASQPSQALPSGFMASPRPGEPNPANTLPLHSNDPIPSTLAPLGESAKPASTPASEGRRRLRWPGIVFPLLFIVLAAIMVYLVLDLSELLPHSKNYRKIPTPDKQSPTSAPNAEERARALVPPTPAGPPIFNIGQEKKTPAANREPGVKKAPLIEEIDRKKKGEVRLPPPLDLSKSDASPRSARTKLSPAQVLDKFLGARTLTERRPYLSDSRRPESILAAGPLAGALPEVINHRSLHYMNDPSEKHTEHFFEVSFQRSPDITPVPILVQLNEWGDGNIKIHTDAFLDLFNDELAAFGRGPVKGERTFHVVADAYKHCFDERIPDAGKKSFIKLRAHPRITPRLRAYFGRNSPISERIAQPDALPWGSSGVCTVTVKWNTSTPEQPFVELIRVDGFTWNP